MNENVYRYCFARSIPPRDIGETLLLSLIAVESLHGHARTRMDARYCFNRKKRLCEIDAATPVGSDLARIFTGYATKEFGEKAVSITRGPAHKCDARGGCRTAAAGAAV